MLKQVKVKLTETEGPRGPPGLQPRAAPAD